MELILSNVPQQWHRKLEMVLAVVHANLFRGLEAVGGKLKITNLRLLFEPHFLNMQTELLEVPIGNILSIRKRNTLVFIPNGVEVRTRSFILHNFVVWNRGKVIRIVEAQIKNAEQAGAGQPATRSDSDLEGGDKPQPESEGRSR